jgi:hypothetical protein
MLRIMANAIIATGFSANRVPTPVNARGLTWTLDLSRARQPPLWIQKATGRLLEPGGD